MLQCVIGSENMELGFKNYVARFTYKSSELNDLWESIQPYAPKVNLTRMMDTWTKQNTFPLLTVTRSGNKITVTQSIYLRDKNTTYDSNESPFKWVDITLICKCELFCLWLQPYLFVWSLKLKTWRQMRNTVILKFCTDLFCNLKPDIDYVVFNFINYKTV